MPQGVKQSTPTHDGSHEDMHEDPSTKTSLFDTSIASTIVPAVGRMRRYSMSKLAPIADDHGIEVECADSDMGGFDDSVADRHYVPPRGDPTSSDDEPKKKKLKSALKRGVSKGLSKITKTLTSVATKISAKASKSEKDSESSYAVPIVNFKHCRLTREKAFDMMINAEEEDLCTSRMKYKAVDGDVYVMEWTKDDTLKSVLHADGQLWKNNSGPQTDNVTIRHLHAMSKEHVEFMKVPKKDRLKAKTPKVCTNQWQKHTFELQDDKVQDTITKKKLFVVQYNGDHNYAMYDNNHCSMEDSGDATPNRTPPASPPASGIKFMYMNN